MDRKNEFFNMSGKTVIITGASSGIGKETAIKLAQSVAKVCLIACRMEELERVKEIILKQGGYAYTYATDITKRKNVKECISKILFE